MTYFTCACVLVLQSFFGPALVFTDTDICVITITHQTLFSQHLVCHLMSDWRAGEEEVEYHCPDPVYVSQCKHIWQYISATI